MTTYPTPPPNEGWCAPGTCGGRWSRVVNGIFETFPLPSGVTILTVPAGETSATLGSPWEGNNPSDEITKLRARIAALEATNAALEDIEYGSPNPDEARATLAKVAAIVADPDAALVVDRVREVLEPSKGMKP